MLNEEVMRNGLSIYFVLVKEGVVSTKSDAAKVYFGDAMVRDFIRVCAMQSGTEILEGMNYIHLINSNAGSLFATPYHELKERNGFKNKEEFYLLSIIAFIYFAEVDGSLVIRSQSERDGISYGKIAQITDTVLEDWLEKTKENDKFEEQWGIDVKSVSELYLNKNLKDEKIQSLQPSFRTKYSIIHKVMRFLKDNKLVRIYESSGNMIVYPTDILFERLEYGYRDDNRYESIKKLIQQTKGVN